MPIQAEIDFASPRAYQTDADDPRVAQLLDLLHGSGWMSGRDIKTRQHWDERTIRLLAAASDGQILSGQRGYKLTCQATPEELHHATAWLESQAEQMSKRARAIRRRWHKEGRQ